MNQQQQIADTLYNLGWVSHNSINDSQSGCVRINTLDELIQAVQACLHVEDKSNDLILERDALAGVIVFGETITAAKALAKRDAVQFRKHINTIHTFDAPTSYGTIKAVSVYNLEDYAQKLMNQAGKL